MTRDLPCAGILIDSDMPLPPGEAAANAAGEGGRSDN
jgi:hypothetical protein